MKGGWLTKGWKKTLRCIEVATAESSAPSPQAEGVNTEELRNLEEISTRQRFRPLKRGHAAHCQRVPCWWMQEQPPVRWWRILAWWHWTEGSHWQGDYCLDPHLPTCSSCTEKPHIVKKEEKFLLPASALQSPTSLLASLTLNHLTGKT